MKRNNHLIEHFRNPQLKHKLSSWWSGVPAGVRRVLLFITIAGVLPWLTITSYDIANYVVGAEQILAGQSVYEPQVRSPITGQLVPNYPYLPSFAMFVALGLTPIYALFEAGFVPEILYESVARQIANAPGYLALVGIPVLVYLIYSEWISEAGENGDIEEWMFWGVLIVALTPALWYQVLESGSDTFVALLSLAGIYAVRRERWMLAGILIGTATFKFTGLPFAAVLALYALYRGRDEFRVVCIGGVVSQIPNILYFAVFFEDFLFVLKRRGAMSLKSGETEAFVTAPLRVTGLEQWYVEIGFIFVFLAFVGLGTFVSLRSGNLLLGFAVSYLATSYFAPVGEVNPSVLIIFLFFEAAVNFRKKSIRYLTAVLLTVELYTFLRRLQHVGHVSAVPFPWFSTVVQVSEFFTLVLILLGLLRFSDHGQFI